MAGLSDTLVIGELIGRERAARDQARWETLAACYHPGSRLRISWFDGSGAEFVEASRAMAARGLLVCHELNSPLVFVTGARALAEVGMVVQIRVALEGEAVDVTSFTRLLYQLERRHDDWGILSIDAIYHKDSMAPAMPGGSLPVDAARLSRYRPSYRCLSYALEAAGKAVAQDLPGDDRPEAVRALRETADLWLSA